MTYPIEDVLDWVASHPGTGLNASHVPGANNAELATLATLGHLCGKALAILAPALADADARLAFCHGNQAVSEWFTGQHCPTPPTETTAAFISLLQSDSEDCLAVLYSQLVAPARRRTLGTFFTRPLEVERMVTGWSENAPAPATVIDIGAGVGIYTISAAHRWPGATVHAIDVNPVTLGLLALRLASTSKHQDDTGTKTLGQSAHGTSVSALSAGTGCNPDEATATQATNSGASTPNTVQLVLDDYVEWATENWRSLPAPRLVLGNPPYTRMQLLPPTVREYLHERSGGLVGRRASLAVLMTAITVTLLEAEDGLCLLLPAQWLESDYAVGLRSWLWYATRRRVELRLFSSALFEDAQIDAVSLLIGPEHDTTQPLRVGTNDNDLKAYDRTGLNPREWRSMFDHRADSQSTGKSPQASAKPTTQAPATSSPTASNRKGRTTLADLATIRRGVATGANWFFVLSEAERDQLGIPYDFVRPLIRRLRDTVIDTDVDRKWQHLIGTARRQGSTDTTVAKMAWLLFTGPHPTDAALKDYIKAGEKNGAARPFLCNQRPCWYDLTPQVHDVDVAVSPMSKGTFRVLEAPEGAAVLNNLYGLVWRENLSATKRARTLAFLRSPAGQDAIQRSARSQANGLLKIEPKAFGAIIVY
ncbi:MAG: class I SAM-dependent methyltransferase [Ornithinimicrobium sp.]